VLGGRVFIVNLIENLIDLSGQVTADEDHD
jgi:hypothetical protein